MPCSRCEACKSHRGFSSSSSSNNHKQCQHHQEQQLPLAINHSSPATIRRLTDENNKIKLRPRPSSANPPPPCRSPNKVVEYGRRLQGTDQDVAPMPLFQSAYTPQQKYVGGVNSLTLGPVNVNRKAMLRRSMEKLPVQPIVDGDDFSNIDSIPFETMWTNPELASPRLTRQQSERGIGDVRWWRKNVSFTLPYSPEVCDYDPNWINSAVQRVISDRGVTVHKLPSYAPQYWDPAAAPNLGEVTTTGAARSWSLEERAARSVGSVRAPIGVSLRCNHFLGNEASVHPKASLAGKCISGETVNCLMSLARPRTISRGCERGANGLSLAKHAFSYEQSIAGSYPGIYPNVGVRH